MRIKAALWGRDLVEALTARSVEAETAEKVSSILTSALKDNPLRCIQDSNKAFSALMKMRSRYTRESLINKLRVIPSFLNDKYSRSTDTKDHVAQAGVKRFHSKSHVDIC